MKSLKDHVCVYDLSSCLPLYQLGCPEHILYSFLRIHRRSISPVQHGNEQSSSLEGKKWQLEPVQLLLDPSKQYLAVVWGFGLLIEMRERPSMGRRAIQEENTRLEGMSIHWALSGEIQHSKLLTAEDGSKELECQVFWLPASSNLVCLSNDGRLLCMTASGQELWSIRNSFRSPGPTQISRALWCGMLAKLSASPCGRWILAIDRAVPCGNRSGPAGEYVGLVSIVEASTGSVKLCHRGQQPFLHVQDVSWSQSGDVCFIQELALVIVAWPRTTTRPPVFQRFKLLRRSEDVWDEDDKDIYNGLHRHLHYSPYNPSLSLSPCDRIVIGAESAWQDNSCNYVHSWQLPPSAPLFAHLQAFQIVEPSVSTGPIAGDPEAYQVAWHPLQSACVCVLSDEKGGIHLIDAGANKCIRSWSVEQLFGSGTSRQLAQPSNSSTLDGGDEISSSKEKADDDCDSPPQEKKRDYHSGIKDYDHEGIGDKDNDEDGPDDATDEAEDDNGFDAFEATLLLFMSPEKDRHVLKWSADGRRLAVTFGARCSLLHFSGSCN